MARLDSLITSIAALAVFFQSLFSCFWSQSSFVDFLMDLSRLRGGFPESIRSVPASARAFRDYVDPACFFFGEFRVEAHVPVFARLEAAAEVQCRSAASDGAATTE
jgi:hypothetical protein